MDQAIITIQIANHNQNIDIETSVDISINKCIEVLYHANLLPVSDSYQYEISEAGEVWEKAEGTTILQDLMIGNGSIIRIREGRERSDEESSSSVLT